MVRDRQERTEPPLAFPDSPDRQAAAGAEVSLPERDLDAPYERLAERAHEQRPTPDDVRALYPFARLARVGERARVKGTLYPTGTVEAFPSLWLLVIRWETGETERIDVRELEVVE